MREPTVRLTEDQLEELAERSRCRNYPRRADIDWLNSIGAWRPSSLRTITSEADL